MRQLTICAAIAVLSLSAIPASAEYHYGPIQQNGQCWKSSFGAANRTFGYWEACPRVASTTTAAAAVRHHRHHASR